MKRDFSELSPREALWVAVGIEERNTQIYRNYSSMFREFDAETAAIFEEMAAEECQHQQALEDRYHQLFGSEPGTLTPNDVEQLIEAPVVRDGELFIYEGITLREALEVGLRAEREARDFYRRLVQTTADPALVELYRELAETENDHEVRLFNKIREYAQKA